MATLSSHVNQFSLKLYDNMAAGQSENFFISPFSVFTVLSMCFAGSRNETSSQLKELLHFDSITANEIFRLNSEFLGGLDQFNGEVTLLTANRIFSCNSFSVKEEFLRILKDFYKSESDSVDFSQSTNAAKSINDYVSKQTNDKIKDLISPDSLNSLTKMVLVNAIYFKGNWLDKFNPNHTQKADFYLSDNSTRKVDMMMLRKKKFNYQENPGGLPASACTLPYVGNQVSMTIILPDEGVDISELEKKLTTKHLENILKNSVTKKEIDIFLPKFQIDYKNEISEILKKFAPHAFNEKLADFSGIADEDQGKLYISAAVHQAFINVNEEGAEAAAATGISMSVKSLRFNPEFKCNRPFIFTIQENKTKAILFMGKYLKPTE